MIILMTGMIEFRGVRSSWATDEKNISLILYDASSSSLILDMSLHTATIRAPIPPGLIVTAFLTYTYLWGNDYCYCSPSATAALRENTHSSCFESWSLFKKLHKSFSTNIIYSCSFTSDSSSDGISLRPLFTSSRKI